MSETKLTHGREEEADAALRHTTFSRGSAAFMVAAFLASLAAVPCVQHLARTAKPTPSLTSGQFRLPRAEELQSYEKSLENGSVVLTGIRPGAQALLTRTFGTGNEQVFVGTDGWLFYRQSVDAIAGEGFMEASAQRRRNRMGEKDPDALKAILDFKAQLAERGIELMVMPVPEKPTIYPEKLWPGHVASAEPPRNASFDEFKRTLEAKGILVYDPTPTLMRAKTRLKPVQYFPTDTHWTPAAVDLAARDLSTLIGMFVPLPERAPIHYTRAGGAGSDPSDLVRLLGLPKNQQFYQPLQVQSNRVLMPDGSPCKPDIKADILLLGDSFSGVYQNAGAGLSQQLSFYLGRPVDQLGYPNGGSWATRYRLCDKMLHGQDHLTGKKLVIYEFVSRDLSFGSWKLLPLPNKPRVARRTATMGEAAKGAA